MMFKVIDNFLSQKLFQKLQKNLLSEEFCWNWSEKIVDDHQAICEDLYNCQLFHMFSVDNQYRLESDREFMIPLIEKLTEYELENDDTNVYTKIHLLRSKCNLNLRTSEHIKSGYHTDFSFDCKTAIYYINTNNGFTEFVDGTKIESVENRIVIFNSDIQHTGVSCTDQKRRVVLNINYSVI